jgi:hypothetical protein
MNTRWLIACLLTLTMGLAACAVAAAAEDADEAVTAFDVADEVARIAAEGELWPGYDPTDFPLALYDGKDTYLFNHPSPLEGFVPVEGRERTFIYTGQHEAMRANTGLDLGSVQTATVMLDMMGDKSLRAVAAVAVHELFHVYQAAHRGQWPYANEAELFTYPVADAGILTLRRLEAEALRRALDAEQPDERRGWAQRALVLRQERFVRMPEGAVQYDRGNELIEGTAHYIQAKAEHNPDLVMIPPEGFGAEQMRPRTYAVGNALALLLDEFRPVWKQQRASGDTAALDEMLREALAGTEGVEPPDFTAEERAAKASMAQTDAEAVVGKREEMKSSFLAQQGFTVTVMASGEPLWPQGFDPMNVQVLGGGEVLHTRWVRLGSDDASLEVLDRWSLTEAAGEHPLFDGVRSITVRGLPGKPLVSMVEGRLKVEVAGFTGEFANAKVEAMEDGLLITLR